MEVLHISKVEKGTADGNDFENNYKSVAEEVTRVEKHDIYHECDYTHFKSVVDGENYRWADNVFFKEEDDRYILYIIVGVNQIMSSSRPPGTSTAFITASDKTDSPKEIHGGTSMFFDFSNTDNDVTAPTGFKRKRMDLQFIDKIWMKEGTIYFHNAAKGAYVSISIVCPSGQYYYKNDGTLAQATEDTIIYKYVTQHFISGDCPMGDEMNTEAAKTEPLPTNYFFRFEVTVPDDNTTCYGFGELEIYRTRTVILE